MTNKLDEIYNMEKDEDEESSKEIIVVDTNNSAAQVADIDLQIVELANVDIHSQEMDQIAKVAIEGHDEAMELSRNVDERNAAHIMAVAAQMLKTAKDALANKQKAKHQAAELLMRKIEIDQNKDLEDAGVYDQEDGVITGDRNEVLKRIKDEGQR